jgi:hypothetical protein
MERFPTKQRYYPYLKQILKESNDPELSGIHRSLDSFSCLNYREYTPWSGASSVGADNSLLSSFRANPKDMRAFTKRLFTKVFTFKRADGIGNRPDKLCIPHDPGHISFEFEASLDHTD